MSNPLTSWIQYEPTIGMLVLVACGLFFGVALRQAPQKTKTFWQWAREILLAAIRALLLLAIILGLRYFLSKKSQESYVSHALIIESRKDIVRDDFGLHILQEGLEVAHFVEEQVLVEVLGDNEGKPPRYINVWERREVPQNSIASFRGQVELQLTDLELRTTGATLFNSYYFNAHYEYQVVNQAEIDTITEFVFQLPYSQHIFENFQVSVNGIDIGSDLSFFMGSFSWTRDMTPGEQLDIIIKFSSTGMDNFHYLVMEQYELQDFQFILSEPGNSPIYTFYNPPIQAVMEPDFEYLQGSSGWVMSWNLDDVIAAPEMGMAYKEMPAAYAPFEKFDAVLLESPNGFALFISLLVMTLIIRNQPIRLQDVILISTLYTMPFLLLSALSSYYDFWTIWYTSVLLAAVPMVFLAVKWYTKLERILFGLLLTGFLFFYPMAGMVWDQRIQSVISSGVFVGIILYLFALSLFTRLESR